MAWVLENRYMSGEKHASSHANSLNKETCPECGARKEDFELVQI